MLAMITIRLRVMLPMIIGGCIVAAGPVEAVVVSPGSVLPDAVSFEYFGLNFAMNERTSNSVGSLNYSGQPGCGGTCVATTALGADPSASVTVNEVTYEFTAGGSAEADLGYYVTYVNSPGIYAVDLHALDSFEIPDGNYAFTNLEIGVAGTNTASFNNIVSTTYQETQCFNGCPSSTPAGATMTPFPADTEIEMQANTLYYVQIDAVIDAGATGVDDTATVDPTFSTDSGGAFLFSPGVLGSTGVSAAPEPSVWALISAGVAGVGLMLRRAKRAGGRSLAKALPA